MTGSIPVTRRERVREAALGEIRQTARRLLVRNDVPSVSLRAIAREMGMTAPALYRYYPSLNHLIRALSADLFDEIRTYVTAFTNAHPEPDPCERLIAASRAFRRWSVEHPTEFALLFASPRHAGDFDPAEEATAAAIRLANVFGTLYRDIWHSAPFPVEPDDAIEPALRQQLEQYAAISGLGAPAGAIKIFLSCWIRVYGAVALEVFGHLKFALANPEYMFEAEIAAGATLLRTAINASPSPAPTAPTAPTGHDGLPPGGTPCCAPPTPHD